MNTLEAVLILILRSMAHLFKNIIITMGGIPPLVPAAFLSLILIPPSLPPSLHHLVKSSPCLPLGTEARFCLHSSHFGPSTHPFYSLTSSPFLTAPILTQYHLIFLYQFIFIFQRGCCAFLPPLSRGMCVCGLFTQ